MPHLLAALYSVGFVTLGLYGARSLLLTAGYLRVRGRRPSEQPVGAAPCVTVQLPIYNERFVAARAIDAACRLRWPPDRLEVQVLDDSTDATRDVVDAAAGAWRSRGIDVRVRRRQVRRGFKAGALADGTAAARGDVLAVFDADFVPDPGFLERTVPFLGPGVAAVQTRWGHLNADRSDVTRAQALALDGHFVVEQTARARLGLLLNFNGTAGLWRRAAIDDAGGWQGDTLSEDVDLSYRAQLAGWRIVFLPEVVTPGELPATLLALKRQQRRWSKGTTQVLLKLGPRLWRAELPLAVRLHALLSLASHLVHPVMVALLVGAPLLVAYRPAFHAALGLLALLALSPPVMYIVALRALYTDWARRLSAYPVLVLLSVGLTLNGTLAVLGALRRDGGSFERTPKVGDGPAGGEPAYRLAAGRLELAEAALAAYAWLGLAAALARGLPGLVPFFAFFACGFTLTAGLSLREAGARRRVRAPIAPEAPPAAR